MNRMMKVWIWVVSALALLSACSDDPYAALKSSALNAGIRQDSVFLGLELGMSRQQFFDRCWSLNRQKLVKEGPSNSSVQYPLKNELGAAAVMQFYPNFHQDRAFEVQVSFYYEGWAPWNRHLFADSLQPKVTALLSDWYDTEFVSLKGTSLGDVQVSMDGNRRILIGVRDEQIVDVSITDMAVADQLREDPLLK